MQLEQIYEAFVDAYYSASRVDSVHPHEVFQESLMEFGIIASYEEVISLAEDIAMEGIVVIHGRMTDESK